MDDMPNEGASAGNVGLQPDGPRTSIDCGSCGRSVSLAASFCPYCGTTIASPPGDPPAAHVPWTPLDMGKAIGFAIAGVIVAFIPLFLIIYLVSGSNPDENDPTFLTISIGSSVVLQIMMLAAVIRFGVGKYHAPWSTLGIRRPRRGGFWLPVPVVLTAYSIMFVYFGILAAFGIHPNADLPEGTFKNLGPIIAVAVLSLAFAPVVEEIFFRGYIFGGLWSRWGVVWGAIGSGLLFGLVHAANPGAFYIVPPIALIGVLFAWTYFYSGSLFPSMAAHFLFNLTSFIIGLTTS